MSQKVSIIKSTDSTMIRLHIESIIAKANAEGYEAVNISSTYIPKDGGYVEYTILYRRFRL